MDPRFMRRGPFVVLGVVTRVRHGSETAELFTGIWREIESHCQEIESLAIGRHCLGVNFSTDKDELTDNLAGMMVAGDAPIPQGLEKRTVSGGEFAVFECPTEAIGESYRYIFTEWPRMPLCAS